MTQLATPLLFWSAAALHLMFLALLWRIPQRDRVLTAYLSVLLLSLAFDTTVVGLGPALLGSELYAALSHSRFALHALVLPGLCLYGLRLVQIGASGLARRWRPASLAWTVMLVTLAWGAYAEIFTLQLVPSEAPEFPRLVDAHAGVPIPTIIVNVFLLHLAAIYWRATRWPWAFLGGLSILLINGSLAGSPHALVGGVLAELLFVFCLLITVRHAARLEADAAVDTSPAT